MAFDPKPLMQENLIALETALQTAYQQGVQDTLARITEAVASPPEHQINPPLRKIGGHLIGSNGGRVTIEVKRRTVVGKRAPRGLVGDVMAKMLTDHPGKSIADYEAMLEDYDDRVAIKSIGNELRRLEDEVYSRDDRGGWHLISNKETADSQANDESAVSDPTNRKGGD